MWAIGPRKEKGFSEIMEVTAIFFFTLRQTEKALEAVKTCFQGIALGFDAFEGAMKALIESCVTTHNTNFRKLYLKSYRLHREEVFEPCRDAPFWRRERLAVECAHQAAMSALPILRSFRRTPTSE